MAPGGSTTNKTILEMKPLPPLDMNSLIPQLQTDGINSAIKTLWEAFSEQQQMCSDLAGQLQQHKEDSENAMTDMKDHLYGIIGGLKDDLRKTKEENKEMNQALKDLIRGTERELTQKVDDNVKNINDKINDVQQQTSHVAHVANTSLERALDAKQKTEECEQKVNDVEDRLSNDLNRLMRTLGLTKSDCRKATDNSKELETMLATPALAHILKLIGDKSTAGLSAEDLNALNDVKARIERLDGRVTEMGGEFRGADKNLSNRIDKLESSVKNLDYNQQHPHDGSFSKSTTSNNNNAGADQLEALTSALSKLRGEVAQLRTTQDQMQRELARKIDKEDFDKLGDAHSALAQRVATLEGTLNDTRGSVDEALRLARQALKNNTGLNQGGNNAGNNSMRRHNDSGVDASALMMLRDQVDGLAGRVASLESELNDIDAKKSTHDELNRALQDVLKAMEQAISQLYDELRKQLAINNNSSPITIDSEDSTSGRYRCLSCNRKSGPLQSSFHERMSRPLLPPSDTLAGNSHGKAGISPPRTSPPRAPQVPGVRDGFEPRPLTGSRRKLQTYYDWLSTKQQGGPDSSSQQQTGSNLATGLVGKQFSKTSNQIPPSSNQQQSSSELPSVAAGGAINNNDIQQQKQDQIITSARVTYAEMPPVRSESPNPATIIGSDGRHYDGAQARNAGSQLPRSTGGTGNPLNYRPQSPRTTVNTPHTVVGNSRPGTATAGRRN